MAAPFKTRLVSRLPVAEGVMDLAFDLVEPPTLIFQGGQFVTLSVGTDAAGTQLRRSYSIASHSNKGHRLRLIVRLIPGGPGSDFFLDMALGTEVEMTGPHGFFVLQAEHPGDVIFAATGTGLAAIMPMLEELARQPPVGRRQVYWGLRSEHDRFVPDEVAALCRGAQAELHTYLSQPTGAWPGDRGRITQAILHILPTLQHPTFYLVGNGAMIQELKRGLMAAGVDRKKQIRTEAFFD